MTITAFIAERVSPQLYKAFLWDGSFESYTQLRAALEKDFGEARDTEFIGSISPMNSDSFVFFLATHIQVSLVDKANTLATISVQVTVPKNYWLIYEVEPEGRATNPRVVTDERFKERYNKLQPLVEPIDFVLTETASIAATEARVRKECAAIALAAKLPAHYRWGQDAMEQFNVGKERAAKAILGEE